MNGFTERKQTEVWVKEGLRKEKMITVAEKVKADQTALLSVQAYRTALGRQRSLSFWGLLLRQIRYTGWMVWLWQAVLFLGIMAVYHALFRTVEGTVDLFFYRRFQNFLCAAGILSAWSSVPFLFRSYRWKMAEVETAARFSMMHLRAAQLLLIGGGAVLMVAGVAGTALLQTAAGTEEVGAYLVFPFLLLGSCILHFLRRGRESCLFRDSSAAGVLILAASLGWSRAVQETGYEPGNSVVWSLCGAAALVLGYQIWKWKKEEENRWNLV